METRRLILLCALGATIFFMWQAWQSDYPAVPPPSASATSSASSGQPSSAQSGDAGRSDVSDIPAPTAGTGKAETSAAPATIGKSSPSDKVLPAGQLVHVRTDKLNVVISTRGAGLRKLTLRGYPVSIQYPQQSLNLLDPGLPDFFVAQSGLVSQDGQAPTHHSQYRAQRMNYALADGSNSISVPMTWTGSDGHKVTKTYTFHRGSYEIDLSYQIANDGQKDWHVSPYLQFWRTPHSAVQNPRFLHSFLGAAVYQKKDNSKDYKFQTIDFDSLKDTPLNVTQQGGWVAMVQHYFIAAVIPPEKATHRFFAKPHDLPGGETAYVDGYVGQRYNVASGQSATIASRLFIGPKLQNVLPGVAPGLGYAVDYGIWTIIAQPIFWVLSEIHRFVGNWGWSIVILTLLIKMLFYKLSEAQYRSMARMRKFSPRIKQLKERHKDDREAMQKSMMDLYKKEGFNPLGGCWPMVFQFPVFIALYWVLRASVELRHAPWILWIQDLAAPDPYYVLPVLFGISMFLQQRLQGTTMAMDDTQRKLMSIMPVGMAVFFAFFPAGLVLYWFTSNLIGITQQWFITRKIDAEGPSRAKA